MNPYWNASCDVPGCTYSGACNYFMGANMDDGSCDYESCVISGCTYESALNYSPDATEDDSSCEFSSCLADLNSDGIVGTQDLLMFLSEFGFSCN